MSSSMPDFKPDIPEYLLAGASPAERYLIEKVSVLDKKTDWQSTELIDQGTTQDQILVEARRTNGRITKLETDVVDLQGLAASARADLKVLDLALKVMRSKWFWIAVGLVLFGVFPFLYSMHFTLHDLIRFAISLAT